MDRMKTKFIIAVTTRLAAAEDSNAKTDLIEELSENLYQRYLDLVAAGAGRAAGLAAGPPPGPGARVGVRAGVRRRGAALPVRV